MMIKFKLLSKDAKVPTKNLVTDLGYDLYASEDTILKEGEITMVNTAIAMQLPQWFGAIIKDRSSCASLGLTTHAGVIDNGYNGEIKVLMRYIPSKKVKEVDFLDDDENAKFIEKHSNNLPHLTISQRSFCELKTNRYFIKKGDKIAQFIPVKTEHFDTEVVTYLDETQRGDKGFGSSGK